MGVQASTRTSAVSMKQHLWFSSVHQYKQHLVWRFVLSSLCVAASSFATLLDLPAAWLS